MPNVASVHLVQLRPRRRLAMMARLPVERRRLADVPGLVLGRAVGTAKGQSTGRVTDLSRWAVFAVWQDEGALDEWELTSPLLARWREGAIEMWSARLECLTAHGRWGGVEPFPGMAGLAHDDGGGPVAVLTQARVRLRHLRRFYRVTPGVSEAVAAADGRLASIGFGEWPVGWQGTFSLWRSTEDLTAFAYGHSYHREVVRHTRAEHWYGEELFARFAPYRSAGAWGGADPLSR